MKNATTYRRYIGLRIYDFKYQKISTIGQTCIYCGCAAGVWDHVPPVSIASGYDGHFIKVPSCKDCNAFLSAAPIMDLRGRRIHIIQRMLVKRRKFLATPDWDGMELSEITGWVNRYIRAHLKKRNQLRRKIAYMNKNIEERFSDYIINFSEIKNVSGGDRYDGDIIKIGYVEPQRADIC
jgi:hypothetical protein